MAHSVVHDNVDKIMQHWTVTCVKCIVSLLFSLLSCSSQKILLESQSLHPSEQTLLLRHPVLPGEANDLLAAGGSSRPAKYT